MSRYEGGFIGNRPQWTSINRTGIWTPQSVFHRQKQDLWYDRIQSFVLFFSPKLWLDASNESSFGIADNKVIEWRDLSGNNYSFSQINPAQRPSRTIENTVSFVGSQNTFLTGGDILNLGAQDVTYFLVGRRLLNTNASFYAKALFAGAANRYAFISNSSDLELTFTPTNSTSGIIASTPFTSNTYQIFTQDFSFTEQKIKLSVNTEIKTSESVTWNDSFVSTFRFLIGAYNNSSDTGIVYPLTGDIAELIRIDGLLSNDDRQQIEGYLAWKWSLVNNLPVNHPYKLVPPY